MGCTVIAINGMPDHVHVLLRVPARHSPASVANQLKGASSRLVARNFTGCEHFAWQEGYGVFSLSRNELDRVTGYIRRQKEHHAAGKVWETLEATSQDLSADKEE
jgi:REP element-mobilizing transposase RayT